MSKKVVVHYASNLNISFSGTHDVFVMSDEEYESYLEDGGGEFPEDYLIEYADDWIHEHVEAYAEVVDVDD